MRHFLRVALVVLVLGLAGCRSGGPAPERPVQPGAVIETNDFTDPASFEIAEHHRSYLGMADGIYRVAAVDDEGAFWGQGSALHSDVMIEVDAQLEAGGDESALAVICRASPFNNGEGYYFAISPAGQFYILRGADGDTLILAEGTVNGALLAEAGSFNRLRAVCLGDYLALYLNDAFLGATTDKAYTQGVTGLAVLPPPGQSDATAIFHDLVLYDVSFAP